MLWRVASADDDLPVDVADGQDLTLSKPLVTGGQRHVFWLRRKLASCLTHGIHNGARDAALQKEIRHVPGALVLHGVLHDARLVVLAITHGQRGAVMIRKKPGLPCVIWVHVRTNDALDRLAPKMRLRDGKPQLAGLFATNARVDDRPTGIAFKQVQVDVVETHGQWHSQPKYPGRDFDHLAGFGRFGKGIRNHACSQRKNQPGWYIKSVHRASRRRLHSPE